jgi:hypothetical protein
MTDAPATTACPPHLWDVTTIRIENAFYYHHVCKRCGTLKDTPVAVATNKAWGTNSARKTP